MGMCSVGKNEDALKLSELILETSMITSRSFETQKKWIKVDDSYFQGRLYKQTVFVLFTQKISLSYYTMIFINYFHNRLIL